MAGIAPMVVTADGKRAGAAEQLAAFTKLLGISLVVASHPLTLGRALMQRRDAAPILIDTPGFDPFDPAQRDEIQALVAASDATPVLVLPAGMDVAEAAELGLAYAEAGARLLVATRFDVARRLGGILAAAAEADLALAEAGIGPGAADGLLPITPAWLAGRLLAIPGPKVPA
jgi:flagellar biosynthesis protein FlhF